MTASRRLVLEATRGADVAVQSARLLAPLRAEPALMETLETYLSLGSSKAATAAALRMHRNTVIKRLDRIAGLLRLDLEDADVRLALGIACRSQAPSTDEG